jgi:hypothetical protein
MKDIGKLAGILRRRARHDNPGAVNAVAPAKHNHKMLLYIVFTG